MQNHTMLFIASAKYCHARHKLFKWLKNKDSVDLVYTYWNTSFSYAACAAKEEGLVSKVVSRVHRCDLYEERTRNKYLPLKRQFINLLNQLYVLSAEAKQYCQINWDLDPGKISISPLGVFVPSCVCRPSSEGELNVVSVSSLSQVKRVDKIINSLLLFAINNPEINIIWTHAGTGPLKNTLTMLADQTLSKQKNISYSLLGQLDNNKVQQIYANNRVDVFVNSSESEGIPVSIMEAMSAGVPSIAPNVGGISELVGKDCGILLSSNPSIEDISASYAIIYANKKDDNIRINARMQVSNNYNAEINYVGFIHSLENIIDNQINANDAH